MDYCNGKATVIAINDNYKLAPWADYLYFCDPGWWEWHKGLEFSGKIHSQYQENDKTARDSRVEYIESRKEAGLSTDRSYINQGQNSGYQAINLAYHLGATRIILLGYDMQPTGGKRHWFGDHPNNSQSNYGTFIADFRHIPPQLPKLGLEIINCTRQTALDCFPKQDLRDAL